MEGTECLLFGHDQTCVPFLQEDFWRMLWDHNAQTVVLLSKIDHEDFPVFWPPGQSKQTEGKGEDGVSADSSLSAGLELDCESFRVRFVEETVHQVIKQFSSLTQVLQPSFDNQDILYG